MYESENRSVVSSSLRLWTVACRFLCPWNSPGKNTGVGSCFFSRGSSQARDWTQVSHIAGRFFIVWATREAQEYWSGEPLSLLQQIFTTQKSKQSLLHFRWILYQLSYQGSSRILESVAYLFSSRYSQPRDKTQVSRIAGGFFILWATGKPHLKFLEQNF